MISVFGVAIPLLAAGLDLASSTRGARMPRTAQYALLLVVTLAPPRASAACYGFSHGSKTAFKSVSSR